MCPSSEREEYISVKRLKLKKKKKKKKKKHGVDGVISTGSVYFEQQEAPGE